MSPGAAEGPTARRDPAALPVLSLRGDGVCLSWLAGVTWQHSTERMNRRTGGLRMAKTQGSTMELIERNLRARRSHSCLSSFLLNLFT